MPLKTQQFVLLPTRGLRAAASNSTFALREFLGGVGTSATRGGALGMEVAETMPVQMRVLDSIHSDGPKLVEMAPDSTSALRANQPGIRIAPVVYYRPALAPRFEIKSAPKAAKAAVRLKLQIVSKHDGRPVVGAFVVAFTDFANRLGAQTTTNKKGEASLTLGGSSKKVERLYVYPSSGFWSAFKKNLTLISGMKIGLEPVTLNFTDVLRYFYGRATENAGAGVKVGVIDAGIDTKHPDLNVNGGANTVVGENPNEYGDNGKHHGTHVAGIIAARGLPPTGLRGLAPAVTLYSYRVFGKNQGEASNYAIVKAIDRAILDGCDLINMSLGGGPLDIAIQDAIEYARAQGCLVIVAAGNDDRSPVSFPASDSLAIAVSAMGRKKTFPSGTADAGDVASPYGKDKKNFVAAFSNIGPEIDLTGPGVAILSTVPGGYTPMSGTSMACPAITGFAAKLLSTRADILGMPRSPARSEAITQALLQAAKPLGFGPRYEGQGLPR